MSSLTNVFVSVNRQEAIRRGINGTDSPVLVAIDVSQLTQEQRNLVARIYDSETQDYFSRRELHFRPRLRKPSENGTCDAHLVVVAPTQDGVVEALDEFLAAEASREAQRLAKEQADQAFAKELAPRIAAWLDSATAADLLRESLTVDANYFHAPPVPHDGSTVDRLQMAYSLIDLAPHRARLEAARRDEKARRDAEAAEKRLAAEKDRTDWIASHGSAKLQRMAAEGIGHDKTYESERAKWEAAQFGAALEAQRPGWYPVRDKGDLLDAADVSLRALTILDAARRLDPSAKLMQRKSDKVWVAVATFRGRLIAWPRD